MILHDGFTVFGAIAVERMRKLVALPVLSADALSSVAYGPDRETWYDPAG